MPDLLRETFEAYAERAPRADGLREAVEARVRRDRTRRRRRTLAGAVATAAAVVAGVAVVRGTEPPPPRPNRLVTEPPAPPGTRWAVGGGIAVAVPEAWFDVLWDPCGMPQADAVFVFYGPVYGDCMGYPEPHHTLVRITTATDPFLATLGQGSDVVVSGVPARRLVGRVVPPGDYYTREDQYAEALVVPGNDAAVLVTTDDPAVARRVLDTVRVTQGTDQRGCAIRIASLDPPGPAARPGADREMVPGTPVQASVCRYDGKGRLLRSALVDAGVTALAGELDGLDKTPSAVHPGQYGRLWSLTFRYETGPDVVVHVVRNTAPEVEGATNGTLSAGVSASLGEALRPLVGWNALWDDKAVRFT